VLGDQFVAQQPGGDPATRVHQSLIERRPRRRAVASSGREGCPHGVMVRFPVPPTPANTKPPGKAQGHARFRSRRGLENPLSLAGVGVVWGCETRWVDCGAGGSAEQVGLAEGADDPDAKGDNSESGDHRGERGARSLGRLSRKATMPVSNNTRAVVAVMATEQPPRS
jgi:hypothetical protein